MKFSNLDFEFNKDVMVVGDLHGVWNRLNSLAAKHKPKVILQAGDFGWWPKFDNTTKISTGVWRRRLGESILAPKMQTKWRQDGIKIRNSMLYFCPGNHEDWVDLESYATSVNPYPIELLKNIYYMPKCSRLYLPDGRQVLFIGGAKSIDAAERAAYYDWFPQELITLDDVDALPDTNIDIVVSHTCPTEFKEQLNDGVDDWRLNDPYWLQKFSDPSCHYLSKVLRKYDPKYWFFGHFHLCKVGRTYNTNWFALNKTGETGWWTFLPK